MFKIKVHEKKKELELWHLDMICVMRTSNDS